jgi:hypothetical protein
MLNIIAYIEIFNIYAIVFCESILIINLTKEDCYEKNRSVHYRSGWHVIGLWVPFPVIRYISGAGRDRCNSATAESSSLSSATVLLSSVSLLLLGVMQSFRFKSRDLVSAFFVFDLKYYTTKRG